MAENTSVPTRRPLRARRLALLASVAGLGVAVVLGGPAVRGIGPAFHSTAYAAETAQPAAQRPVGFADIVAKVKPAVISVRVKIERSGSDMMSQDENGQNWQGTPFERFFRQFGMPNTPHERQVVTGEGSGFFITADGYAVTNNHVVDHAKTVQVTTNDGKVYTAKVVGTDPKTDLALIKVDGHSDFPFVQFANASPQIGDWVIAVGNPFGLSETVTAGIVSARGRDIGAGPYDDFIQIDAPINKGNSGGPTFDVDGQVVGVNTAIVSPSGGSIGIGFAIPAGTAKTVVAQLKDMGFVTRGWMGVEIQKITADIAEGLGLKNVEGALIAQPQPNSPAAKAGIESGDVVTAVNGQAVKDAHDLARRIATMAPGASVKLSVVRQGTEKDFTVTLAEFPKTRTAQTGDENNATRDNHVPRLGLRLAPAEAEGAGDKGVVVTDIDPNGTAAEHGMRSGDVILDVGGKSVSTPTQVRDAVRDAQAAGKHAVLMRVQSGEQTRFVAVPFGNG
jgi:serine protease Do